MAQQAIGMIDSGVGGLTILGKAMQKLPNENFIYVGDNKRAPYGTRTVQEVQDFSLELAEFLMTKEIKLLVIACNTATITSLGLLQEKLPIPVIGVVEPTVEAALEASEKGRIGVIGTEVTIQSQTYEDMLNHNQSDLAVFSRACPSFVTLVENHLDNQEGLKQEVAKSLEPFKDKDLDTLILGCTHFPFLSEEIQKFLGEDVNLVDSSQVIPQRIHDLLEEEGLLAPLSQTGKLQAYTTGDVTRFKEIAENWLDLPEIKVEKLEL